MTSRYPLRWLPVMAVAVLSGCSWLLGDEGMFPDRSEDYKKAPEYAPIDVPEDKDASELQEIYVIPPVRDTFVLEGEFAIPRPTPLVAGAGDDVVRIQRLGDESWALVAVAPGQLWPQVRSFLAAANIQVARVDASAGIMESNWLQLADASMASRFQFRIERGVQRGTSELHVLQMNQAGDIEAWPEVSDDLDQESEMLRSVAQFIANSADEAPVSMIADQAISASGRISMQESPEGYTYIDLGLPFNRAWAAMPKALEASSFEITDRNRSAGEYYVRFLGPQNQEEDGWFDWLWGDDDEHPLAGQEFLVKLTEQNPEAVTIRLMPRDPKAAVEKREEQALLSIIKGNIS
jgi:outer membrane protein assembly factor BamC